MELSKAIQERRSVRKYQTKAIPDDILKDIIETAIWAPSAVNLQPWYFVVIRSPEERQQLRDLLLLTRKRLQPTLEERFKDHPEVVEETLTFMETMGGAPVCILAFLYTEYDDIRHISSIQSVAAAMHNIELLAYEKGIGSCWTTGSLKAAKEIEQRYGQGRGEYVGMLSLGYCDFPSYAPPRKKGRYNFI